MSNALLRHAHLDKVQVSAYARLHLGFLDLNGSIGRKFGSFGLAINSHQTNLRVQRSDHLHIENASSSVSQKALNVIDKFYQTIGQRVEKEQRLVKLKFEELIPEHAGLGSGTQFTLAIATALAKLHGFNTNTPDIAQEFGRGQRSGIGIATFDQGGFIVDGGNKPDTSMPPMLLRQPFPEEWHIVLIMDTHHRGVHGEQELSAFKQLPIFSKANAQAICHLTLMQLLPALVERDLDQFGAAITQIQTLIGDHFAPAQGGRYTSDLVAKLLLHAQTLGFIGIAQSSWGPTGCIFTANLDQAEQLITELNNYSLSNSGLKTQPQLIITQGHNTGSTINTYTV